MAMYEAKAKGSGHFELYQPAMEQVLHRRIELEKHLRHALERDELEVRYQPRIDLRTDTPFPNSRFAVEVPKMSQQFRNLRVTCRGGIGLRNLLFFVQFLLSEFS